MAKFEKHVSLLNATRTTTSTSYTFTSDRNPIWYYDSSVFDNVSAIYFEGVLRSDTGTAYLTLTKVSDGTEVTGAEISTTATSNTRVRSGDIKANLTTGTDYRAEWKASAGATSSLDAARIVIVQDGSVTKTETVIELVEDNGVATSYGTAKTNTNVQYIFQYNSAEWDGTVNIYLEADLKCGFSSRTAYANLYDVTSSAYVTSAEISHTGDTTATRVRSSAITLTDGHEYLLTGKSANTASEDLLAGKIVIQQSGTPTVTTSYVTVLNTQTSGSDSTYSYQNRLIDFTAGNWSGTTETFYYETTGDGNTSALNNAYYNLYNDTDATQITEVNIETTSNDRYRSSSLTMPSDSGNSLNSGRKHDLSVSVLVQRSFLIATVDYATASETFTPIVIIY